MNVFGTARHVAEWSLQSRVTRDDPWGQTSVTVEITSPEGRAWRVPAFWAAGQEWRVRFAPPTEGTYSFRTECADASDAGLHGVEGTLSVAPYAHLDNPLIEHGAVRVAEGGRYFAHEDGTPFFWLGDTWWMLMSDRVSWPDGFRTLTADRASKGFTVVQTVVGFPPDTEPFDGRDGNEGGSPWEKDYVRINPAYFDAVDLRIEWLVRSGIVPCILGSWGYHLVFMTEERMTSHWRYLVARYGAYPVVWCLAGETGMCFYLSKDRDAETKKQTAAYARIASVVREADPFDRLITTHPRNRSWQDIDDPSALDFHMLQTGHIPPSSLETGVKFVEEARAQFPDKPVVNGEPPYEGHMGGNWGDVQRFAFWTAILTGAAGMTYGAAGIYQANDRARPTGHRPDGGAFDRTFWDEAITFPGVRHLAVAKRLLTSLPFQRFEPHPEWAELGVKWGAEHYRPSYRAYCAGVPKECRVVYMPMRYYHWDGPLVRELEPDVTYRARYVDTETGDAHDLGEVTRGTDGTWKAPTLPTLHDWVLVLET